MRWGGNCQSEHKSNKKLDLLFDIQRCKIRDADLLPFFRTIIRDHKAVSSNFWESRSFPGSSNGVPTPYKFCKGDSGKIVLTNEGKMIDLV